MKNLTFAGWCILIGLCLLLISFATDKPFIVVKGEKYYKCSQYTKTFSDTTYTGYGTMFIEKTSTTVTTYDAIDCNDLKK